ncbi:MAG TPA: 50S ribosomal protein L5 [Candidatus Saccharimonadales bacterium]|nr:50S ribosomal protein L5 [Candidatus Saccharimonadales bacterium]
MTLIDVKERSVSTRLALSEQLEIKNHLALPKISKVSINVGLGQSKTDKDMVEYIGKTLALITGQKPVNTYAKKAIAGFKLRAGDHVGMRVTLRGNKMYDFLNRLINITLPRIREFRGITESQFDAQGNLTLGFKDQVSFAELGHDVLDRPFGLSITIAISHSNPAKSVVLLKTLGFPFQLG